MGKVWERFKDGLFRKSHSYHQEVHATMRYIWGNALSVLMIFGFITLVISLAITHVSTEVDIECTTGYVGLDLEFNNYIQNYTTIEELPGNWGWEYTHFNETLLLDHININGIDDMRCRASMKADGPAYLLWFGGW